MRHWSRLAVLGWASITALVVGQVAALYAWHGADGVRAFLQEGPNSNLRLTLLAVGLVWTLAGAAMLATRRTWTSVGVIRAVCVMALAFLYVNVMREHITYADAGVHIDAATSLHDGHSLPSQYVYPPLWATLLSPFTPLGPQNVFALCWLANLLSLLVLLVLLPRVLARYGFSPLLATALAFAFCLLNVPILRTLDYMQVNFQVTNLILACVLLYPAHPTLSALMLALAVHLNVSPIVLVMPFILTLDVRWLTRFGVMMVILAVIPALAYGLSPYADFARNIAHIHGASPLVFRNSSIDSFVLSAEALAHVHWRLDTFLVLATKVLLVLACLALAVRAAHHRLFLAGEGRVATLFNALPPLLVMMVTASPLVWEHHGVMLGLSYLVLIPVLSNRREWSLFAFLYFLEFLVPTFDFFPWSYGRLLSPLLLLWLTWSVCGRRPTAAFDHLNRWAGTDLPAALARLTAGARPATVLAPAPASE